MTLRVDILKTNSVYRLEEVKKNVSSGEIIDQEMEAAIAVIEKMCDDLNSTFYDIVNSLW
jgi:hypothetical protein